MMMVFIEEKKWNGDGGARWHSAERRNKKEADEAQQMIMMEQVMYMVIIDASEVGNGVGEVGNGVGVVC